MLLLFESPLFCRVSEEQREKFTQHTEILKHGVKFSVPDCAEFTVFTTSGLQRISHCLVSQCKQCQTFHFYHSFSIYQSSWRKKCISIRGKPLCFIHRDILLAVGIVKSKIRVNLVVLSGIRLAFIRRHKSFDMSTLKLPLEATKLSGGWSQVQWVQASQSTGSSHNKI